MRGFTFFEALERSGSSNWCATLKALEKGLAVMKAGIHPAYEEINVICACGNTFRTRSTNKGDIRVEICSNCHPFFTGRQKLVDTEGRVDRFQKKIQKSKDLKETRSKKQPVAVK
jgi:large subunit ribosomal protein L31